MLHETEKNSLFFLSFHYYFSATEFYFIFFSSSFLNYFAHTRKKREICKIVAIAPSVLIERNSNRNQRIQYVELCVRVSFYFVVVKCAWTVFITCNECWWSFRTLRFVLFCFVFCFFDGGDTQFVVKITDCDSCHLD